MAKISTKAPEETERKWDALEKLKEKWPSPFVSRDRVPEFTEGMFKQRSMNTFDARGDGVNKRYRRGAKVFYEADDLIEWLKTKIK